MKIWLECFTPDFRRLSDAELARIVYQPRSGGRLTARVLRDDGPVIGPDAALEVLAATGEQHEPLALAGFDLGPTGLDAA